MGSMKRRDFLNTSLAAVGVSALPPIAIAAPAAPTITAGQYAWAVAAAKARDAVSADVLASSLKISAEQASVMMARLQARGVISAPVQGGTARVLAPVFRASGLTGGTAIASGKAAAKISSPTAQRVLGEMMDAVERKRDATSASPLETDEGQASVNPDDSDRPAASIEVRSAE